MSQKSSKRSKKIVDDEVTNAEFKAPETTKPKDEATKDLNNENAATNGGESKETPKKSPRKEETASVDSVNGDEDNSALRQGVQTRSRSSTPLVKNIEATNGVKDESPKNEEKIESQEEKEIKIDEKPEEIKEPGSPSNSVEMDPLILDKEDETIPELQFDENDIEVESEGSNSRCKTRRSVSRNVSTPKTPKVGEHEEFEIVDQFLERAGSTTPKMGLKNIMCEIDLNDSSDTQSSVSISNISTRALAGSDARNMDFTGQDSGLFEDQPSNTSSKSFADTLKNLSGRKGIRSLGNTPNRTDYLKHVLKKKRRYENKGDIYAEYESVERVPMGVKRKSRSFSPTHSKRMKREHSGIFSYFSNPLSNFRNSFKRSSSPQLLTMETKCAFDEDEKFDKIKIEVGADSEKKWCNVM